MAQKSLSKKAKLRRKIFIIFAVCVGLGILALFTYAPFFQIQGVRIEGIRHTQISAVDADIRERISGYRYGIIPNSNIVIYQKRAIERYILEGYPSVEHIDIGVDRHRVLHVRIKDRKPLGVWCGDACYLYDVGGIIFKKSFMYTGPLFVGWSRDTREPVTLLQPVSCDGLCTDMAFMSFLKTLRIEKAIIGKHQLTLISSDGYYIITEPYASSTMSRIQNLVGHKADILQRVEYIDIRFPNKIFYKEKGE